MFEFLNMDFLTDGEIDLMLQSKTPQDENTGYVPAYKYAIALHNSTDKIGSISIRIGSNEKLEYGGHIGYSINKACRGNHYAGKACSLIKQVALAHGMYRLVTSCNPNNIASRKTCEYIGAKLLGIYEIPSDFELYRQGERYACKFEWLFQA
jgi:predicted acetyltransferase